VKTIDEINKLIGSLPDANLPLMLLPIQIQTRFVEQANHPQLLIRMLPTDPHIYSHETLLTSAEAIWGRDYWNAIWSTQNDEQKSRKAWEQIVDRFGTRRSAWVVKQTTPTNLSQRGRRPPVFPSRNSLKTDSWTQPALARLLPDRWVVAGYIAGQRVLLDTSLPIPDQLSVSLSPNKESQTLPSDELPIDPDMRWLVDFDEAEQKGMAVRLPLPPELIGKKIDRLLVFGVKSSSNAQVSSKFLEEQLDAHHYTRGVEILASGTPTNNSTDTSTQFTRHDPDAQSSFDVEINPPPLENGDGGALVSRMFGVKTDVLQAIKGSNQKEDLAARHMLTALWSVTGGYFLEQILAPPDGQKPLFSQADLDQARRYCIDFVRPGGPLPVIRLGAQPYGVLPLLSLDWLAKTSTEHQRFVQSLLMLRTIWEKHLVNVPNLRSGIQVEDQLVEILRMQPVSSGVQARMVFDQQFFLPTGILQRQDDSVFKNIKSHFAILREHLRESGAEDWISLTRIMELIPTEMAQLLTGSLVQPDGDAASTMLSPNYINFLRTASFDDILNENFQPGDPSQPFTPTLLYLLLRHSVLLTYIDVARRILYQPPIREPVLVDIAGEVKPDRTRTFLRILDLDPTLRSKLHTLTANQNPEAARLDELRESLSYLENLPVDMLARQMCSCLDLFAYRLDAWITSLATERLLKLRASQPLGSNIGGFGWVEDLEPAPRRLATSVPPGEEASHLYMADEKGGFIHAPSQEQAATAAVLRSGYLTQTGEDNSHPFAIDLSSRRVRMAQWLLDGIRQGQSLGTLLGYRFERGLHERQLDRFIDDFRRISLLAALYEATQHLKQAQNIPQKQAAQLEVDAAREVLKTRYQLSTELDIPSLEKISISILVDGLVLNQLFVDGKLPFSQLASPISNQAHTGLIEELQALQDAVDSLSDAITAEGVYNMVLGNPTRAAASLNAVAQGDIQPPELTFMQTHQNGNPITHRVTAIFSGSTLPVPPGPHTTRARAEPRINNWLNQMFGSLKNVICMADFLDETGAVIGKRQQMPLSALEITHSDVIYMSATANPGQPTALERLLEYRFLESAPSNIPETAQVHIVYERPSSGFTNSQLSLGQFMEMAAEFRQTIFAARPLRDQDLIKTDTDSPSTWNTTEFKGRVDRAVLLSRQALNALIAQHKVTAKASSQALASNLKVLREKLLDLFCIGFASALPLSARGSSPSIRDELLLQAEFVEKEVSKQFDQIQIDDSGFGRAKANPDQIIEHDLKRIKSVFGRSFVALPLFRPANSPELQKAFQASAKLLDDNPLQALSWLQTVSRVRPAVSHLNGALSFAAAFNRSYALELKVAQLPLVVNEHWTGLPVAPGTTMPVGKLSLMAHLPRPFVSTAPMAGLLIDDWVEVIPASQTTTGLAFNYDAPGARPPQTVLLAVTPPNVSKWEIETLEKTLLECLDLAKIRAVDSQALGEEIMVQSLFPALYVSNNLSGDTISTDFTKAI